MSSREQLGMIASAGSRSMHGESVSMHGESAARRQAVTELLFFASVGDLGRCRKICDTWRIDPKDAACCDYDKRTPLHLAASEGCYSVAQWLLDERGADANAVDRFKRTPLEDAVRGDHGELVALLTSKGGRVLSRDGRLVDLADSGLATGARVFAELDPEWEIDPKLLHFGDKVGEGEFGNVFLATLLGTPVAVKVLKDNDAVTLGDFRTELNVLQKLHHPHCVQFFGAVTKSSPYMIVTEFMGAGTLADLFRSKNRLSLRRCVQLALECARGIAYLHNRQPQGIIHRDLKPANLMIGGGPIELFGDPVATQKLLNAVGVVKLADFGLSKSLKLTLGRPGAAESEATEVAALRAAGLLTPSPEAPAAPRPLAKTALQAAGRGGEGGSFRRGLLSAASGLGLGGRTSKPASSAGGSDNGGAGDAANAAAAGPAYAMTGETGSYRYMAPEVFRHEPYNHKVDQYSFAMLCYQLFEGVPPFWDTDPVEAAAAAARHGARPAWGEPHGHGRQLPDKLKRVVEACWAADYETRPEFLQVIASLEEVLRELPPESARRRR